MAKIISASTMPSNLYLNYLHAAEHTVDGLSQEMTDESTPQCGSTNESTPQCDFTPTDGLPIPNENQIFDSRNGIFEVQYFGQGLEAAEIRSAWETCTKNPGHTNFIPIKDFSMNHLPEMIRTQNKLDAIQYVSKRVVRVRSNYTSQERLEYGADPSNLGSHPHYGTGYVTGIVPLAGIGECDHPKNSDEDYPSPFISDRLQILNGTSYAASMAQVAGLAGGGCCKYCAEYYLNPSSSDRWLVGILTAAHVILNDEEAQGAWVDLFYDDEESRSDGRLVSLKVVHVHDVWPESDLCIVHCVVEGRKNVEPLWFLHESEYFLKENDGYPTHNQNETCVVLVSHPHGKSKHVSVGKRTYLAPDSPFSRDVLRLEYDTPTCAGSSGAILIKLWPDGEYKDYGIFVHSTGFDTKTNGSSLLQWWARDCYI